MNRLGAMLELTGALCWVSMGMWIGCFAFAYLCDVLHCRRKARSLQATEAWPFVPRPELPSLESEWASFLDSLPEVPR